MSPETIIQPTPEKPERSEEAEQENYIGEIAGDKTEQPVSPIEEKTTAALVNTENNVSKPASTSFFRRLAQKVKKPKLPDSKKNPEPTRRRDIELEPIAFKQPADLEPTKHTRYRGVSFAVLRYIARQNIRSKKLRSFLTILGIVIGIGAVFFLLSFGLGLRNLVTNEILGNTSVKAIDVTNPNSQILDLDDGQVNRMKELGHQVGVGASFSFPGSVTYQNSEIDAATFGVDKSYQSILDLQVVAGRRIESDDNKVVVVNTAVLRSMGVTDQKEILNKTLLLRVPMRNVTTAKAKILEQELKVVGVVESGNGAEIYVPNFMFSNAGATNYSQVKVLADDTESIATLRQQIESYGFETASPVDTIAEINQVFRFFNLALAGFGAIGMVVAILGMFNTLTISLLERTREIGLMVALGARRRDVRRMFIVEALQLSLIGAVGGMVLSGILSAVVNGIVVNMARSRGVTDAFILFSYPWWLIIGLVGGMLGIGFLVAYFPARRAERINPIDALRRE